MKVEYVNPFINALLEVLETMAQVEATPNKPRLKEEPKTSGEVTGFIHMKGEDVECTLAISFSETAMKAIASKMLGEEITELDGDVVDLAGEITNMVTGGAKKALWKDGFNFDLSQPTFEVGHDYEPPHLEDCKVLAIDFNTDAGTFSLEASMKDSRQRAELKT